jgi:hypothetical protein
MSLITRKDNGTSTHLDFDNSEANSDGKLRASVGVHLDHQHVDFSSHTFTDPVPFGTLLIADVTVFISSVESVRGLIAALEKIEVHLAKSISSEEAA